MRRKQNSKDMVNFLNNISWSQYLGAIGLASAVYYLIVGLRFYRQQIIARLRGGSSQAQAEELQDDNPAGELMEDLESTVNDIAHRILVPGKQATKEELLAQLTERVASFGGLRRPGYRYALNNYIIEKAGQNCGIEYTEQELEQAWQQLMR